VRLSARWSWLLVVLAVVTWALVHASGIHATVGGVLLALTVPVAAKKVGPSPDVGRAEYIEHLLRPLSSGFAVPVFAFFAAGVSISGSGGIGAALNDRVTIGVVVALVAGKAIGVSGATYLVARFTRARLDEDMTWWDVLGLSLLAGMGFTVSLLIGELAFGPSSDRDAHVKVGILAGSLLSAALAAVVLGARNRLHKQV
jgi:NhaA family Na+:H+ antiporter